MKKFLQNKKGRYSFRQSKRGARCPKDFCKCLISFSPPPGMDVEHTPWKGWGWGGGPVYFIVLSYSFFTCLVFCASKVSYMFLYSCSA